jgi:predicted regulator of Ras-like GTPase activity (Roadblock/LC7/MglB family)
MAKLEQVIQQFKSELGNDFVSTDVVGMDGISIAGGSVDPNFSASDASARFAEVMKLAIKVSNKIDIGKVEDNLVTTDKNYIILRSLGDASYYWVVVVTTNATLGTLRMLMNEFAPQIWDAIPHMVSMPTINEILEKPMDIKIQPEVVKPSKPRGSFWADQKMDKKEDNPEDAGAKTYKYP